MVGIEQRGHISRLLIVDDDLAQLRTLTDIMATEGFEVVACSTASEALEHLVGDEIAVAVVDLRLPDLSGTQLLERLQSLSASVDVVIHTAYSSYESARDALNLGAFAYVEKTGGPDQLIHHVHRAFQARLERYTRDLENAVLERTRELEKAFEELQQEMAERKRAEEAYLTLVDYSLQGLVIFQEGRVVFANQAMAEITGYTVDEMLALSAEEVRAFVHPEDQPIVWNRHRDRLEGKPLPERYELRGIRKDGSICWLEIHASRIEYRGSPAIQAAYVDVTERKKAEEVLRESEEKYRDLFENAGGGIITIDLEARITGTNRKVEEYGFIRQELIGKKLFDFVPKYDQARAVSDFEVLVGGSPVQSEMDVSTPRGIMSVEYSDNPIVRAGEVIGVQAILTDITERKRAEGSLHESEERYRSLTDDVLDSSAVGIFIIDAQFKIAWINQAMERFFGLRREQVLGKDKRQMILERIQKILECPEAFVEKVLATYDDNTYAERFECHVLAGGEREQRWLEHRSMPIQSGIYAGGRIEHYYDVTQRKRAEEAYRSLVDHSLQGLIIVQEGRAVFANRAMAEITGYTVEEMLAMSAEELQAFVHPDDRSLVWSRHRDRLNGEPLPERYEFRGVRKDGSICRLEIYPRRIEYQGKPAVQAAHVDVTERRAAEEELRRAEAQLAHAGRLSAMGEMVAGIAHEVNQPLYSILNFAKAGRNVLAAEGPPDLDNLRQWNDEIATAAADAGEILDRLRGYARKTEPSRVSICMSDLIEEAVELLAFEARQRQIAVDFARRETPVFVHADRVQIEEVLVNLLRNAFEAIEHGSPDSPQVTIRVRPAGQFVGISVTDNGAGLPPKGQSDIFDPFVTTKPEGLGMGLAISRSIAEAHGGRLRADSNPEGGATVHFLLPICDAPDCRPSETGGRTDAD